MASEGLSRRGLLTGAAAAAMAVAVPVAATMAPETAEAQTARPASASSRLTTIMTRSMDAGRAAAEFSDEPNHIGVVVFYASHLDPTEYGDAFASELIRRGINARSFAAPVGGNGISVHYQVGETGLGPLEVRQAAASMSQAVELSQARDRVLSPSYTPSGARGG